MSSRHEAEARTIHPRALAELGEKACIVALGVARDLRSGMIPPESYDQRVYCGSSFCIAGHMASRLGMGVHHFLDLDGIVISPSLRWGGSSLFGYNRKSEPTAAADAIERYVYDGSETPWSAT